MPPSKRQRTLATDGQYWNRDILKTVCSFLDLPAVNTMALVCAEWRDTVWGHDKIWKGLLIQRYPNLTAIEHVKDILNGGRDMFIRTLGLHSCPTLPVREFRSLPPPLQRRIPGDVLLEQWKPESVVFLVDIWKDSTRILSHYWRVRPGSEILELTFQKELKCDKEILATSDTVREMQGDIGRDSTMALFKTPLYGKISYFVEGGKVPLSDPVVLLSEHVGFFAHYYDYNEAPHLNLRTDVDQGWIQKPNYVEHANGYASHESMGADTQRKMELVNEQEARYGCAPLPFDPSLEITMSPVDYTCQVRIENDSALKFNVRVQLEFCLGQNYGLPASTVLPCLLSMWNDAARGRKRRGL